MGYLTRLGGELVFDPPLSAAEFANSPFTEFSDEGSWSFKLASPTALVPYEDRTKAYEIDEELQAFVDSMPGATFTGFISGEGEESEDVWRLYVAAGRVVKIAPEIVWPTDPSELAEHAAAEILGKGWFVAPDGYSEPTVWMPKPGDPNTPIAVISEGKAGPALWAVLTALIPAMGDGEL